MIRACKLEAENVVFIATYLRQPVEMVLDLYNFANKHGEEIYIVFGIINLERSWTYIEKHGFQAAYKEIETQAKFEFRLVEAK